MAAKKTKTVEDYEQELADERAKWEAKKKSLERAVAEARKERKRKEAEAVEKAAQTVGEEVLSLFDDWKAIDFDALSLALAEVPGLVPVVEGLDVSAEAARARLDAYYARLHAKK